MINNIKTLVPFLLFTQLMFSTLSYAGEIEVHPEDKPYLDALITRLNIDKNKIKIWNSILDEKRKIHSDYHKVVGDFKKFYFYDNEPYQNIKFITDHEDRIVYLRVMESKIEDLTEIKNFKKIKWLDLHVTNIKSLKGVDNLASLERFDFNGNDEINSLSDVKNLPDLKYLLPNTSENITDISGMKNLPNLKEFDCGYCRITDLSVLSDFPLLEHLEIGTTDKNLKPIEKLSRMKSLKVTSNTLTDISAIDNLVNLEELDISDVKVEQLKLDRLMPKLKKISLNKVPLTKFIDFSKTPNLEKLLIIRSSISDLSFPENLRNLREIYFFVNENLKNVKGLIGLPNLEIVEFTRSPIGTIEINSLPKLNKLDLSGTNITQIGDFSKFPSLRELYLRDTKVTSLEPILDAPRLWLVGLDRSARDIPNVSLITKALKVNALTRYEDDDTPTAREKYQQLIAEQKESITETKKTSRRRRN